MRLTILAVGSRGDVQPCLALGTELLRAGHDIRVATHTKYEPLVVGVGLPFAPLAEGRLSEGPATGEGRRWQDSGSRHLPPWVGYLRDARSVARRRLADALVACRDTDAVLASDLATLLGWQVSEHYRRPLVRVSLNLPVFRGGQSGPVVGALRGALWRLARPWLDRVRRDVGLSAIDPSEPIGELEQRRALVLNAYSPAIGPPSDARREWTHTTGYWFLDHDLDPPPPAGLEEFLGAGSPPVCIGFGSMLDADPMRSTQVAVDALHRAGRRGILIRGQWGLRGTALRPDVFAVDTISHDWLFKRCAAVVHHAAAGTTAAALHAGVPSIPVPHMGDQKRWSKRIHRLGVATRPLARRRLNGERLAEAISEAVDDPAMRARARELAQRIQDERGTRRAVELLEAHLGPLAVRTPGQAETVVTKPKS